MEDKEKQIDPKGNWKLTKISMELGRWGEDEGIYTGSVHFSNDEHEYFKFNIPPDMAHAYMELIAEGVVIAAEMLGQQIKSSFINRGFIDKVHE